MTSPKQNFNEYMQPIISEILEEHRSSCERGKKFIAAEKAKKRIERLIEGEQQRKMSQLLQKQEQELAEIYEAQQLEFEELVTIWDQKIDEVRTESNHQMNELEAKFSAERKQVADMMEKQIPQKPKDSGELLSLITSQKFLIKSKQYTEAQQVQHRINNMRQKEQAYWRQQKERKIKNALINLQRKHDKEKRRLELRLRKFEDELNKLRVMDLERALQRYQNVKKGVTNSQQNEIVKFTSRTSIANITS